MLESTIKDRSGLEKKTGHMSAIDKHLIPFTGEDRHNGNFVISGKPKGGTSQFETYATMQVVTEKQLPTIAVVRVIEDMSKIEFVRKLLSESKKLGLKKPPLLTDREFSSVDAMRFLDECGEKFLMAVGKRPGIKKAVSEFRRGKRGAISRYEMRSGDGTTFRFWLVVKKRLKEKNGKRRWEYLTYATNVERWCIKRTVKDVLEEYKKRWRTENNFKSVEQMRARTCSRNHAIRVFTFFLSMIVCNLWYAAARKMNEVIEIKLGRYAKKYGSWCIPSVAHCIGQEDYKIGRQEIRILFTMCAVGVHFQLLTYHYAIKRKGFDLHCCCSEFLTCHHAGGE